jgi:hypothetical protein
MSSQRFSLHRSVLIAAALTLAFMLASPPASVAAPLFPNITDPEATATPFWLKIEMKIVSGLRSIFQAADTATGDPAPDAVDPWDDDLGKKPPQ